jgi:transcriptional regulator with XRE-family HTH domain
MKLSEDLIFATTVKKALIDRGLTITKLADELGMCRTHVSNVVNGTRPSKPAKEAICEYLGITA